MAILNDISNEIIKEGTQSILNKRKVTELCIGVGKQMVCRNPVNEQHLQRQRERVGVAESEELQQLKNIFSKTNMEDMADCILEANQDRLWETVRGKIHRLFTTELLSAQLADGYAKRYYEIFMGELSNFTNNRYERAALGELSKGMDMIKSAQEKNYSLQKQQYLDLKGTVEFIEGALGRISQDQRRILEQTTTSISIVEEDAIDDRQMDYFRQLPISNEQRKWVHSNWMEGLYADENNCVQNIRNLTECWKRERKEYPEWYVMPYDEARSLRYHTFTRGLLGNRQLDVDSMTAFAFEYTWRLDKAMILLEAYDSRELTRIFFAYFEEHKNSGNSQQDLNEKWFFIGVFLLREAKEEWDLAKWEDIYSVLEEGVTSEHNRSILWIARVECLYAFGKWNDVLMEVKSHDLEKESLDIQLKCAGMLAACGEEMAGIDILEKMERNITQGDMNSFTEKEQLYQNSILACCYQLHYFLLSSLRALIRYGTTEIDNSRKPLKQWDEKEWENKRIELMQHLKQLEGYFNFDETMLKLESDLLKWQYDMERKSPLFDFTRESVTIIGGDVNSCEAGYYLYRMLERCGLPLCLNHMVLLSSHLEHYMIKALLDVCPPLGVQLFLRGSSDKIIKSELNRKYIFLITREQSDMLLNQVLEAVRHSIRNKHRVENYILENNFNFTIENGMELMVRFSSFCSSYQYRELISIVIELLDSGLAWEYGKMDGFLTAIFKNLPEKETAGELNRFVKSSIRSDRPFFRQSTIDVMEVLNRHELAKPIFQQAQLDHQYIRQLLCKHYTTEEAWRLAVIRLKSLYLMNQMKSEEESLFTELLWSRLDEESGLPALKDYYLYTFLELPAPEGIDVFQRIKKYLLSKDFMAELDREGYQITFGEVRYYEELKRLCIYCEKHPQYRFEEEELCQIVQSFLEYWNQNSDKIFAGAKRHTLQIEGEFRKRFLSMQVALGMLLELEPLDFDAKLYEQVQQMYREMFEADLASIHVRFLMGTEEEKQQCQEELLDAIYQGETERHIYDAAYYILTHLSEDAIDRDALLLELIRIARTCNEKTAPSLLILFHNLFYSQRYEFSDVLLKEFCKLLSNILEHVCYEDCVTEENLRRSILIRYCGVHLAYSMYCYCEKKGIEVYSEVNKWKNIIQSGGEFNEVSNEWFL